jgi:hypothetical protein
MGKCGRNEARSAGELIGTSSGNCVGGVFMKELIAASSAPKGTHFADCTWFRRYGATDCICGLPIN